MEMMGNKKINILDQITIRDRIVRKYMRKETFIFSNDYSRNYPISNQDILIKLNV